MTYELCTLHARPDLLDEAARLLNCEWPRSLEARKASIRQSTEGLPFSMLMVAPASNTVVGFARLLEVAGNSQAALVESVVIAPKLRGYGLGRKMMESCEQLLIQLGVTSLHLSTHDQQPFYYHLGYQDGPMVSGVRHSSKLAQESLARVVTAFTECVPREKMTNQLRGSTADNKASLVAELASQPAPPAPPPPKLLTNPKTTVTTTWMVKHFILQ